MFDLFTVQTVVLSQKKRCTQYKCNLLLFQKLCTVSCAELFNWHLPQITELLETIDVFSKWSESKIEGIESLANKFQSVVSNTKKKPYDILDHR